MVRLDLVMVGRLLETQGFFSLGLFTLGLISWRQSSAFLEFVMVRLTTDRRNLPESSGEGGDQVFGKPVPNRLIPGEADAAGRAGVGLLDAVAADWNR